MVSVVFAWAPHYSLTKASTPALHRLCYSANRDCKSSQLIHVFVYTPGPVGSWQPLNVRVASQTLRRAGLGGEIKQKISATARVQE